MNGIENIIEKIRAEGDAEAEAILKKGKAESDAILAQYDKKAETECARILSAAEKRAAEITRRITSAAELEARKSLLKKKQELIEQAFQLSKEKLAALDERSYLALLTRLVSDGAASGREEVLFSPADRARYGKQVVVEANRLIALRGLPGEMTLSADSRRISGGAVLRDGRVEINCALDTILRLKKEELALEVAAALFS